VKFLRRAGDGGGDRWIVAGLGNPGERYSGTRHNAGAMVVDELASRAGASFKRHKSGCLLAEVDLGGRRAVLARPMSYMNESGRPLGELVRWYKTPVEQLVVVHDELDIPFGEVRIKAGGGIAGHNGLSSIASHLKSRDFVRVRVGISRPRGGRDATAYVLEGFSAAERSRLPEVVDRAAEAVERVLEEGVERAMNAINTRPQLSQQ
jgi:peptidyl-tRNA hydrolase, PTH1 family